MSVKLLTEYHLEFLSLKGGFTGLSESTLVKILHCWKSHVTAQLFGEQFGVGVLLVYKFQGFKDKSMTLYLDMAIS